MQSYSRAVVKSFLPLLVFAILIFPAIESKAGEGVPQHPVLIDTSQPGILVFDASENRTLLPLLDDVRKFPDLQTYRDFIHTTFNYEPHHELKGATSLSVVQYGTLYSLVRGDLNHERWGEFLFSDGPLPVIE